MGMLEKSCIRVGTQPGVEQQAHGWSAGLDGTDREQGLITLKGAKAGEHCARLGAEMMPICTRGIVADPLALAIEQGHATVGR
jgi:hypothetical protein